MFSALEELNTAHLEMGSLSNLLHKLNELDGDQRLKSEDFIESMKSLDEATKRLHQASSLVIRSSEISGIYKVSEDFQNDPALSLLVSDSLPPYSEPLDVDEIGERPIEEPTEPGFYDEG